MTITFIISASVPILNVLSNREEYLKFLEPVDANDPYNYTDALRIRSSKIFNM